MTPAFRFFYLSIVSSSNLRTPKNGKGLAMKSTKRDTLPSVAPSLISQRALRSISSESKRPLELN